MTNYFWNDYVDHRKMHLTNWHSICMKKQYEGLGILDIRDLNLCMLSLWVRRYIRDEGKLCRRVVEKKYCRKGNIFCSDKNHASPF
jgi:hypothetical protein